MSNYPDSEGRDYVAEQVASESASPMFDVGVVDMIRCKCGSLVTIDMPKTCQCGKTHAYWRDIQGKIKHLSKMDLGHLNNCVRMLATKSEKYSPEDRGDFEVAIDILYAEIGSRDKEISQLIGIQAALNRSLARE